MEQKQTIIELKRELTKSKDKVAQHQAKDASKHPSKAGETSGDSSDKLSKISEMYRAPGNRNKKIVSNSGPVSSTKSSVKLPFKLPGRTLCHR